MRSICKIENCGRLVVGRGWCRRHYDRWRKYGDPTFCLEEHAYRGVPRNWIKENANYPNNLDCLIWPFARHTHGYAKIANGSAIAIMCEAAHGPAPTSKHEAAHSCGKGHEGCINPSHLRWATRKENHADKKLHGTKINGEKTYNARLNEQLVIEIRALSLVLSRSKIAARFGVSAGCVNGVISRRTWGHIP